MITGKQIKMARAGLDWSIYDLAEKANTTANTISRIEKRGHGLSNTIAAIESALLPHIEFIPENGGGAGVRLKKAE